MAATDTYVSISYKESVIDVLLANARLHMPAIPVLAVTDFSHTIQGFSCLAIQLKDPRFLVLSGAKKNFGQLSLRNCLKAGQIIENSTYNFYIKM